MQPIKPLITDWVTFKYYLTNSYKLQSRLISSAGHYSLWRINILCQTVSNFDAIKSDYINVVIQPILKNMAESKLGLLLDSRVGWYCIFEKCYVLGKTLRYC